MKVRFTKLSPTQNVTILVEDEIDRSLQPEVAARLLEYDSVVGEQVGFLERPTLSGAIVRLQMMGGEFCGNATMSVGAYLARKGGLADGASVDYPLEVSGTEGIVPCHIERRGTAFSGTVSMPLPEGFGSVGLQTDRGATRFDYVALPGITHVILPATAGASREEIERRIRGWSETIRAEAMGVLLYNEERQTLEPIVYVPATDTAVWERGCGSGSAAFGCWRAMGEGKAFRQSIRQPGGEITVSAEMEDGKISGLTITGAVKVTASGIAYI